MKAAVRLAPIGHDSEVSIEIRPGLYVDVSRLCTGATVVTKVGEPTRVQLDLLPADVIARGAVDDDTMAALETLVDVWKTR